MSLRQHQLEEAMRTRDFEKFLALNPKTYEVEDHNLIYQAISTGDDSFWQWYSENDEDHLMMIVLYEHRDFDLASNRYIEMTELSDAPGR